MSDDIAVTLTEDGPVRIRGNGSTWERGETKAVAPDRAEALTETHDYFVIADEADVDDGADAFDVDEWLDQDYQERVDRVESGAVDEHLEEIAEAETSDTVLDAIGVRRAELEG
jgi:hypothetical protein